MTRSWPFALDELSKDNPSYKKFEELHNQVNGRMAAPAVDTNDDGRAGRACGPTTQVTDLVYRAALLS